MVVFVSETKKKFSQYIKFPILIGLIIAIFALVIGSLILKSNKDKSAKTNKSNTPAPTVIIAEPPKVEDAEYARIHQTINGTIVSIKGNIISLKPDNGANQDFKLNDSTKFVKGKDYLDGLKTGVKLNQPASITYNPDSQEVWVLWYDYK